MVEGKAIAVFAGLRDRVSDMPLLIIVYPESRKMGRRKGSLCVAGCCRRLFVDPLVAWISFTSTVPLSLNKSVHLAG